MPVVKDMLTMVVRTGIMSCTHMQNVFDVGVGMFCIGQIVLLIRTIWVLSISTG